MFQALGFNTAQVLQEQGQRRKGARVEGEQVLGQSKMQASNTYNK